MPNLHTKDLIEKLYQKNSLDEDELLFVLNNLNDENFEYLIQKSRELSLIKHGNTVHLRGLIEFTNYCARDCRYCGIRKSNDKVRRYRMTDREILETCRQGDKLGYKTFVLQGGEDISLSDEWICNIIKRIKSEISCCAITLSIGEKSYESYKKYFDAGADRYLLRHETASRELYKTLHPKMSFQNRIECLKNLKKIGFQVGAGFMVGLPDQTNYDYVKDIMFLKDLQPHMVGIGPFIPQSQTPLAQETGGNLKMTVTMIAIVRLFLPDALIPATTALGSIDPNGREKGLLSGANVVMPNLTPTKYRKDYLLYDGKICVADEAENSRHCIEEKIENAGFSIDLSVGHHRLYSRI